MLNENVAHTQTHIRIYIGYVYATLLEKYTTIFFRKPGEFQWSALAWGDLEPAYAYVNFPRPSVASVDDKQPLSEVVFSALVGFSL